MDYHETFGESRVRSLGRLGLFTNASDNPFSRNASHQLVEAHLDTIAAIKFCGRSELLRNGKFSDLYLQTPPEMWLHPSARNFKADCFRYDVDKTDKTSAVLHKGALREAIDLSTDLRTALALQLHHLTVLEGYADRLVHDFGAVEEEVAMEALGRPTMAVVVRPWMDWAIMPGWLAGKGAKGLSKRRDLCKAVSSGTQRRRFKLTAAADGLKLKKGTATHERRHASHRMYAGNKDRHAKAAWGGWEEGAGEMEKVYDDPLGWAQMAEASGHCNEPINQLESVWDAMDVMAALDEHELRAPMPFVSALADIRDANRSIFGDFSADDSFVELVQVAVYAQ